MPTVRHAFGKRRQILVKGVKFLLLTIRSTTSRRQRLSTAFASQIITFLAASIRLYYYLNEIRGSDQEESSSRFDEATF